MKISGTRFLVTGGTGFIGSGLVRGLLAAGAFVRSLDNDSRGARGRLASLKEHHGNKLELVDGDIRDAKAVAAATEGVDSVAHLAYVNGTEFFYSKPELVLEVAVKGMINVLDACEEHGVRDVVLASSSEVYQTPPSVPTDESAPLSVPDVLNPRYSYGGGKIISELLAINYGRKKLDRVTIFRPHKCVSTRRSPSPSFTPAISRFDVGIMAIRFTTAPLPSLGTTPASIPWRRITISSRASSVCCSASTATCTPSTRRWQRCDISRRKSAALG